MVFLSHPALAGEYHLHGKRAVEIITQTPALFAPPPHGKGHR